MNEINKFNFFFNATLLNQKTLKNILKSFFILFYFILFFLKKELCLIK